MSAIFDRPENIFSIYSVKARHKNTESASDDYILLI